MRNKNLKRAILSLCFLLLLAVPIIALGVGFSISSIQSVFADILNAIKSKLDSIASIIPNLFLAGLSDAPGQSASTATPDDWVPSTATYNRDKFKPFETYSYDNVMAMVNAIRAEGHAIPTGHPRIFISPNNKEALRQKIATYYLDWMQEAVDLAHDNFGAVFTDYGGGNGNEPDAQPVILANAMIYQLGEIEGVNYYGRTPAEYGQEGVRHLMATLDYPVPGGKYQHVPYLAPPIGYDWLYGLLNTDQKNSLAALLLENAQSQSQARIENTPPGARLLGAVAIYGDGYDDSAAEAAIARFYDGVVFGDVANYPIEENGLNFHADNIFVPEGPGNEGYGYASYITHPFLAFLEAWYDQTGEDYFKLSPYQNYVYHSLHITGNEQEHAQKGQGAEKRPWRLPPANEMPLLEVALARSNGTAASLAKSSGNNWMRQSIMIIYMLRADPNVEALSPTELGIPTTAHFRGVNSVFARNSWEGTDTAWAWFQSPTWTNIRELGPLNDLLIWKNGGMLLGKHQQSHDYDGGNRTNTLVLYDENQPDTTFIPLNVMDRSWNRPLGLDLRGGDSLTELNKGLIGYHEGLRYFQEEPGEYLYAFGDGGQTFKGLGGGTLQMDNWSRQFIWFRNDNNNEIDTFFVLDRVENPAETVSAQVPLHFGKSPEIRNSQTNLPLGEGVLDGASGRFIRTTIGAVIYYSVVDYEEGITIEFVDPRIPNSPLSVSVADKAIRVSLGTDSSGAIVSKNQNVAALVNSDAATSGLVNAYAVGSAEKNQVAVPTGGPVPLVDGGIWKYEKQNVIPEEVANRIVATNTVTTDWGTAHGRLFVDTLFPKEPTYYRMGGIEERNIDLFGNLRLSKLAVSGSPDNPGNILEGMWRIQIGGPGGGRNQTFLNVMQATDSSVDIPNTTTLIEGTGIIGAKVANNIALFNRIEDKLITGEITISEGIAGAFRLLIADLDPEAAYEVKLDGTVINTDNTQASDAATLYFDNITLTPGQTLFINKTGEPNNPPVVDAGTNQTITLPTNQVTLQGQVTDDGLPNPPRTITTTWSKTSGPGTVTFANINALNTTATFSGVGVYTLKLSATDSALTASDNMTITINPPTPPPPPPPPPETCQDQDEDDIDDYDENTCPSGRDMCVKRRSELTRQEKRQLRPISNNFELEYDQDEEDDDYDENTEDIANLPDFKITKANQARIKFNNRLNLIRLNQADGCFVRLDLDNGIDIDANKAEINTTLYPELNKPAQITFYNVTLENPVIKKDGVICQEPACRILNYDRTNHILTIQVQGFSKYAIQPYSSYIIQTIISYAIIVLALSAGVLSAIYSFLPKKVR